jgi:putative oxidoreductase
MSARATYVAALGRLLIAVIFIVSGVGKILAPAVTQGYIAAAGLPSPLAGYLIAVAIEVGGGILLVIGFQTKLVAVALAIFSVVAAASFHNDFASQDQLFQLLKDFSMAGGLLQVAAFGPGPLSVDARRGLLPAMSPAK